jgi:hypothetical protein
MLIILVQWRNGQITLWYRGIQLFQQSDEFIGDFPITQHALPGLVLREYGEELEILVDALVHALHIPQIKREVFGMCVAGADLALKENEGASLGYYVAAELGKEEVHHMDVALVDW